MRYLPYLLALTLVGCGSSNTAGVVADNDSTHATLDSTVTYEITSASTGQSLDIVGISQDDGAQLQQYTYGGGRNQQWTLAPQSANGSFAIISVNSGKVLDVPGSNKSEGVIIWQWDWLDQANQQWWFNQQPDGSYQIVNVNSGLCLDLINNLSQPGTRVQQWGCWGGVNQQWNFVQVSQTAAATPAPAPAPAPTPTPTPTANPVQAIAGLDFQAPGNESSNIVDYGGWLQGNKDHLQAALDAAGASQSERALVTAMAMLETTDMDPSQRDASKDGTSAANLSILNLNLDMVQQLGYQGSDNGARLNDPNDLTEVVGLLLHGIRTWGVASTLNFQRGGRTAFNDGVSYGAADYRNVIASIYARIAADPSLLYDSRRVEIYLQHV